MMRRRGPGLVRTVGRTAVIAGTATAVSNRVSRRQQGRQDAHAQEEYAEQAALDSQQQIADMQAQMNAMQAQQAQAAMAAAPAVAPMPAAAPAPAAGGGDMMAQLQQLAQMKEAGLLTDAQFDAAKSKLLGI
jgi:Short C-terminal domain